MGNEEMTLVLRSVVCLQESPGVALHMSDIIWDHLLIKRPLNFFQKVY